MASSQDTLPASCTLRQADAAASTSTPVIPADAALLMLGRLGRTRLDLQVPRVGGEHGRVHARPPAGDHAFDAAFIAPRELRIDSDARSGSGDRKARRPPGLNPPLLKPRAAET